MALKQTILFTVMPRGISVDADSLPISVFVSPRLEGAKRLDAFPDWLRWTRRLKQRGLDLELQCGTRKLTRSIDRGPLRPALWEELFKEDTLVRSRIVEDYSERGIISYPVRQTLSALKAIYQEATVALALPDGAVGAEAGHEQGNRRLLRELVRGLEVNWNGDEAPRWREIVRITKKTADMAEAQQALSGPLDREGLIESKPDASALQKVAVPFAVFHHMPTPKRDKLKIDPDTLFDFHQALSALNSYPDLLRALGLVFDLDLPRQFVAEAPLGQFGTLSISKVRPGWDWSLTPATPPLATAYVHSKFGNQKFFLTAPRIMSDPSVPASVLGLLNLDPERFGLAQVDVDGGMHKAIMLAETLSPPPGHNLVGSAEPERAPNPEVFDPEATLPALRSGGLSLFADRRALALLDTLTQSKAFNEALVSSGVQPRPFFAEDLVRGYRLDVWDSRTAAWHSLHLRNADYQIGDLPFSPDTQPEEGWVQLAVTQPAKGAKPVTNDLYLHEAIARWAGWSLSAPMPAKHLSRYPNPKDAVPRDNAPRKFAEDEPVTPFKVTAKYEVVPGSLPRLRFGARYRLRARPVDLAGNSLRFDDTFAERLSVVFALPQDPEGFAYLRFEPVAAPLVILRDPKAVTDPGSAVDRVVIRTFNDEIANDAASADTTAADRHIVPPRTSVEMGERLGMFDDGGGKLKSDAATWTLIGQRDAGEFNKTAITVAGKTDEYPLEAANRVDELPHLPDPLSRGAAIRDLPGTPSGAIGKVAPGAGAASSIDYNPLSDPNPRLGSATLVSFANTPDWEKTVGFRFALAEPAPGETDLRPQWEPAGRVLTVSLPKGQTKVVPLASYASTDDLKLLGVWQWLRQYIERVTVTDPQPRFLQAGADVDRLAHVLQRAVEGGHWMLTPPRLLTLVHAVQQPLDRPVFTGLHVEHEDAKWDKNPLQTAPDRGRTDPTELAAITAWRRPGATDAFLLGALKVHGASTAKLDLLAAWNDPMDDVAQSKPTTAQLSASVDELPLKTLGEDYLVAPGEESRAVGYYDPEHDQIALVRAGDWAGTKKGNRLQFWHAAPRHLFNDTKRHIVSYTAVATSRYQEYFPPNQGGGFTRSSEPVTVDVPASARPLAPDVVYVVPTFGWQRQSETNLKRSVRFGGGLRVYLRRPWFSSGEGERLGVALYSSANGPLDKQRRDKFKPFITQWGMDPIWQTAKLTGAPGVYNFPDAVDGEWDWGVSLEESSARDQKTDSPARVDVVGFEVEFDESRGLWFADLTVNTFTDTYTPFVRLALVRYQPHALADAKVSRVVLADFAQLTPERSATVTSDPHHAKTIRLVVSGVAPVGPKPIFHGQPPEKLGVHSPTQISVRVQVRDENLASDLAWHDVPSNVAKVIQDFSVVFESNLVRWAGWVTFGETPQVGRYRLLIEEFEYISASFPLEKGTTDLPKRLIYAEIFELDSALISES
jgi:hypothetical protein